MGFSGDRYTWARNKTSKEATRERLEKFLVNEDMWLKAKEMKVQHLNFHHSDHRPIIMEFSSTNVPNQASFRKKKVKMEEFWTEMEGSRKAFKEAWTATNNISNINFTSRIQEGLVEMSRWNRNRLQGSIIGAIDRKEREIQALELCPNQMNADSISKAERELETLLREEESYWKIRTREDWLKSGDKNTKWFHQRASFRKKKNEIKGILDERNRWTENEEEIGQIATTFFKKLLTSNYPTKESISGGACNHSNLGR